MSDTIEPAPVQDPILEGGQKQVANTWWRWFDELERIVNLISIGGVLSINGQTGVVVLDLDDLNDVNASSPSNGDRLMFNGTNWVSISSKNRNTTTATIDSSAYNWLGNTDSGAFTYTLPAGTDGTQYRIVNTGTSGNNLTIAPNGSDDLLGANSSFVLADGEALEIVFDTTDGWY